jgi:putative colanic acid biosynthesis UDP-glucose lipid carrier transferase
MIPNKASVFALHAETLVYWKSNDYKKYVMGKKGYYLLKRIFDIVFSLFLIVFILSWMLPVLAICIRLDSKGPVLFLQKRVGKGGRPFICYKLRSMYLNVEADYRGAGRNDERITRFGIFLRRSNLDELPQLLNVLTGDMSLVGPRPHMLTDVQAFTSLIPGYEFRSLIRPGMTGLAQVKGFSGPAENRESIFGRYQWDAFYVRNAGFWLDLRIIRRTVLMLAAFLLQRNSPGSLLRG